MIRIAPATRRTLAAIVLATLLGALAAAPSSAEARVRAIASPGPNSIVKGMLKIRPYVAARKGPYEVTIWIDGKRYDQQPAQTRKIARSGVPIDTTELKNGSHRLKVRIKARSQPRGATQTIRFRVKNRKRGPAGAGQRAPRGNAKDFKLLVSENFNRKARTGSFDPDPLPWNAPVYTGSSGTPWIAYPSSYLDTFLKHPYRAKEVLSVHDHVLDYHLHPVDGKTAGASLSPVLPHGSQYQTYGRYAMRFRISSTSLSLYHAVFLLWPDFNDHYHFAESDFPETSLDAGRRAITGYSHFGMYSEQEVVVTPPIDLREWHTYAQEWTPTERRFYLDDVLVHKTNHDIWKGPMRWEMQIQTYRKNGNQSGHLYVDWAAVWGWAPGTRRSR